MRAIKQVIIIAGMLFSLTSSLYSQTSITVDPSKPHQTIEGWGTSLCWWANVTGAWTQGAIDNITWKAAVDLNMNIFRFNIGGGDNPTCQWGDHIRTDGGKMPGYRGYWPDQQGWGVCDLNNDWRQQKIMDNLASQRNNSGKNDVITEVFSNSPPYFMTKSYCAAGAWSGEENLDPNRIDDFADYLACVTKNLIDRNGHWNIQYIEPFNEPDSNWWKAGGNQEGCQITPDTQEAVLWRLWQRQDAYGIGYVNRTASDCNTVSEAQWNAWYLWKYWLPEYNGLAKINTHTYGGTWQEKVALHNDCVNGGKKLWQSETGPMGFDPGDGQWWKTHYMMAYRQIEDLRCLQCTAWCDWQFMAGGDTWGLLRYDPNPSNWGDPNRQWYTETRGYYCRKQVNYFIKQGYKIIDSSDGNTIAAVNPANTEIVLVIVNPSNNSNYVAFDLTRFNPITGYETYRTSGDWDTGENCSLITAYAENGTGTLSANKIRYNAKPWSVTTIVCHTDGGVNTGTYKLINACSGKGLGAAGGGTTNGTGLDQWDYFGAAGQKWTFNILGGGVYKITNAASGRALDVANWSTTNGSKVQLWDWWGGDCQKWRLKKVGGNHVIINVFNGKALDLYNWNSANGAPVYQWDEGDGTNQQWSIQAP